jgi:hypothetical protein
MAGKRAELLLTEINNIGDVEWRPGSCHQSVQLNTLDKQTYLHFHPNIISSLAEILEKKYFHL